MISSLIPLALALAAAPAAPTPQSLPAIVVRANNLQLHVQVARTPGERERGLMYVTRLPRHHGMLFVFDGDAPVAFWMKDTLIPLDMVFVGADAIVRTVFANVKVVPATLPDSQIPLEQAQAKYVIELPAGEARMDRLRTGSRIDGLPGAGAP